MLSFQKQCPKDWIRLLDSCYRVINASYWTVANATCGELGGYLSVITSELEHDDIAAN